jgi:hypothetical protein
VLLLPRPADAEVRRELDEELRLELVEEPRRELAEEVRRPDEVDLLRAVEVDRSLTCFCARANSRSSVFPSLPLKRRAPETSVRSSLWRSRVPWLAPRPVSLRSSASASVAASRDLFSRLSAAGSLKAR